MTSLDKFIDILRAVDGINRPAAISDVDLKSSRYVLNIEYKGQKAVARCYKEISQKTRGMFDNEIAALNSLAGTFLKAPKVLFWDEDNLFQIVTFLEGKSGGNSLVFNKEFIDKIAPDSVSEYFRSLQQREMEIRQLPQSLEDRYLENIKFIEESWPFEVNKIAQISDYVRKKKFMEDQMVISHGDANGGNFIFNDEGFGVIDWETVEYNSKSNDFATIYIGSLVWPEWQKFFLSSLQLTEKELFSLNNYAGFRLANLISKLNLMLTQESGELFRSGKMTKSQIRDLIGTFLKALDDLKL